MHNPSFYFALFSDCGGIDMQTKWKKWIKKGEKSYLLWRHFLPFSLRWTICQQFIAKIHEHIRAYHISSSHVRISGRKCYYKKNLWNTSLVYWKVSGLKLESTIITRCFSPAEEKMLAWHWKENHYNHIYIKKKMRRNLKYTFLPELREFVLDLSGFSDQYNLITWRQIASEHDQR